MDWGDCIESWAFQLPPFLRSPRLSFRQDTHLSIISDSSDVALFLHWVLDPIKGVLDLSALLGINWFLSLILSWLSSSCVSFRHPLGRFRLLAAEKRLSGFQRGLSLYFIQHQSTSSMSWDQFRTAWSFLRLIWKSAPLELLVGLRLECLLLILSFSLVAWHVFDHFLGVFLFLHNSCYKRFLSIVVYITVSSLLSLHESSNKIWIIFTRSSLTSIWSGTWRDRFSWRRVLILIVLLSGEIALGDNLGLENNIFLSSRLWRTLVSSWQPRVHPISHLLQLPHFSLFLLLLSNSSLFTWDLFISWTGSLNWPIWASWRRSRRRDFFYFNYSSLAFLRCYLVQSSLICTYLFFHLPLILK